MKEHGHVAACPLLLWLWIAGTRGECPAVCSCSESHRTVDCSWRGLRFLPVVLQTNIQLLNLTHNRLSDLNHHLSSFTHLRILDLSFNRLQVFPASLPRALWEIDVSGNRLHLLNKDDTAYQWNLRVLDLSVNMLERVVFINNTLPSLKALNLSHNRFWTVPTNMPRNLEVVDLSHNTLVQILPGSLSHLPRLARFFLHSNRFATIGEGAFAHLRALRLITLQDNPWACEEAATISHLLAWTRSTAARVLGCPCHNGHTCGEALLTDMLSPYVFGTEEPSRPYTHAVTGFWLETLLNTEENQLFYAGEQREAGGAIQTTSALPLSEAHSTTKSNPVPGKSTTSTMRRSTTLRTRSVKRANQNMGPNSSDAGQLSGSLCCWFFLIGAFLNTR